MTDERRLYLVLSIAAAHATQCFLRKLNSVQTTVLSLNYQNARK